MEFIAKAYRTIQGAAWPSLCHLCDQWCWGAVCDACQSQHLRQVPRCRLCALPSVHTLCSDCQGSSPVWTACFAALPFFEPWRSLITAFKFHGEASLARVLGRYLRSEAQNQGLLNQIDLVLPVPLSRERLRERGFNQSLLLARELKHPGLLPDGLLRLRHTAAQASLPRHERLQNLTHAMACNPRHVPHLQQQRVLLVDDVMTTGSTLTACCQALRSVGVRDIQLLVLARAEAHEAPQSGLATPPHHVQHRSRSP